MLSEHRRLRCNARLASNGTRCSSHAPCKQILPSSVTSSTGEHGDPSPSEEGEHLVQTRGVAAASRPPAPQRHPSPLACPPTHHRPTHRSPHPRACLLLRSAGWKGVSPGPLWQPDPRPCARARLERVLTHSWLARQPCPLARPKPQSPTPARRPLPRRHALQPAPRRPQRFNRPRHGGPGRRRAGRGPHHSTPESSGGTQSSSSSCACTHTRTRTGEESHAKMPCCNGGWVRWWERSGEEE